MKDLALRGTSGLRAVCMDILLSLVTPPHPITWLDSFCVFSLRWRLALRKYERLPQKEREALERAFFQYDADLSGYLDWEEVVPALRELGLSGSNAIEKRDAWTKVGLNE